MQAKQNLYRNVASAPARHLHIQDPVQAGHICDVWVTPQKLTWRRTAAGITMYLAIDLDLYQGVVAREDQTDNAYSLHLIGANRELNIEIGRFEQLDAGRTGAVSPGFPCWWKPKAGLCGPCPRA